MTTLTTGPTRHHAGVPPAALPALAVQAAWFVAGAAVAFAAPYVFSSVLDLHHDLYLLAYFVTMGAFLGAYVTITHADMAGMFRRAWKPSLAIGALSGAFVVFNVLRGDGTPRPDGAYFGFELLWRGLTYGAVDAAVLSAFPALVAYRMLGGDVHGWVKRAGYAALTLALMWGITATYHLGYEQYREDGVANPEIGNTVISLPAILTTNPAGSFIAHPAMHIAAVIHNYETDVFLPPQTDAD